MTENKQVDLGRLIKSAERLGIELDESAAQDWLTAIEQSKTEDDIVFDDRAGVFGHKISMLDFNPEDLAHFRKVGRLVEFQDIPGKVETALALSGSAAQSKIQVYPGDADYFERVNILAETKDDACRVLAQLIKEKVINTHSGPTYHLMEVRFGSYPQEVMVDHISYPAGSSISWNPEQILDGKIKASAPDGSPVEILWDEIAFDPGWCKLDWVVADPVRNELVNVSNMLDVTWEAPDGTIIPLDGFLDPYFQEIYLDNTSIPIFSKLSQHVSANALDEYVEQLEKEVDKYITKTINYGKDLAHFLFDLFPLPVKIATPVRADSRSEPAFPQQFPAALIHALHSLP